MVAAIVQSKPGNYTINGLAASVTLDAAPTPGNHLIAAIWSGAANATITFPSFSQLMTVDDSGRTTSAYYRKVLAGDGTTWSFQATDADPATSTETSELHLFEVSGLDDTALLHASAGGTAGTFGGGTPISVGPINVTDADGAFILAACGIGGAPGTGTQTITGGFTQDITQTVTRLFVGTRITTGAVSGISATFDWPTARRANALLIALAAKTPPAPAATYRAQVYNGTVWRDHEIYLV